MTSIGDAYKQLMHLQELYNQEKMKLESAKPSDADSLINKPRPQITKPRRTHEACDTEQFLECIRIVISRHGGSTHIDTIIEFLKRRLPKMRKPDGTPFSDTDFRKRTTAIINGKPTIFSSDRDSEDCWRIKRDESPLSNFEECIPLYQFILSFVESRDDYVTLEDIRRHVKNTWPVPILKGEVLSDEEIEEAIRLNIDSHPIIRQYDHGGMLLMTRKRRRVAEPKKSKKQEDYDDYEDEDDDQSYSDSPLPPPVQPQAEKTSKKSKAKGKVEPSDGPWIQCEKCGGWIEARTDVYITDLWLYDDENPDHLVYWCPNCRNIHGSPTPPGSKKKRGGPGRGRTKTKPQAQ